jgi:hypothetical protein
MRKDSPADHPKEKRAETRTDTLRRHRVEIKFVGEPIYQFKVTDVSRQGAGILINANSRFLKTIAPGQILEANFISPRGAQPAGMFRTEIKHITDMDAGRYKGHKMVGIRILERCKSE